jgi:putative oxidoreductase
MLTFLSKYMDIGILILRIGLGSMFLFHGFPILFGGPEIWKELGNLVMPDISTQSIPVIAGFIAAIAEFAGGFCIILGLFFRPVCLLLAITMTFASVMHIRKGDTLGGASHAIEDGIVFLSFVFIGPGKYSLDEKLSSNSKR